MATDYQFYKDYEAGKIYENITYDLLNYKGYFPKWNESKSIRKINKYDISCTKNDAELLIEVKRDFQTDGTGNFAIEIDSKGLPSGINTTRADQYYYYTDNYLYVLPVHQIRHFMSIPSNIYNLKLKYCKENSRCLLIPKETLLKKIQAPEIPYKIEGNKLKYDHNNTTHTVTLTNQQDNLKPYENLLN